MAKPKLTEKDFRRAAAVLRCEVPAIKAVAQVESRGAGFYGDGFPVILFERHIFRRETKGKFTRSYPHLSGPPGNYGPAGKNQRVKFSQAFELDPIAAMKSCSWGKFQIMGFNHKPCGFASVGEFVDAMKESEGRQLDAFVAFVISQKLDKHLRDKNWTAFARGYNGTGYAKNKYDTKMAAAYTKFLSSPPTTAGGTDSEVPDGTDDSSAVASLSSEHKGETSLNPQEAAKSTADHKPIETVVTRTDGDVTVEASKTNQQDVNVPAEISQPEPYQGVGFWKVIKRDLIAATGGNLSLGSLTEYAQQASGWPPWLVGMIGKLALGVLIATLAYFIFRVIHFGVDSWKKSRKVAVEAEAKTAIDRKDIVWK
jgi:hypothetical protein